MKRVVLSPNPYRDRGFRVLRSAQEILQKSGIECVCALPFEGERLPDMPQDLPFLELRQALKGADAMLCFGGDGTILHCAREATRSHVPLLGVNVGNVGFTAELESGELDLLQKLARDEYSIEERMMLDVTVQRAGRDIYQELALNDAVVTKGAVARVISLTVSCDGVEMTSFSGDGVIVSTPTGSTAYSLSAGGPIVEPTAVNLVVTSICAHAMEAKSFVLAGERVVTVQVGPIGKKSAFLSADGGRAFRLNAFDRVLIRRAEQTTRLIRLKETNFYRVLNHKFKNR